MSYHPHSCPEGCCDAGIVRPEHAAQGKSAEPLYAQGEKPRYRADDVTYGFSGWKTGMPVRYGHKTHSEIVARINALKARRFKMLEYLDLKREELDWHGVQDAASDLRDFDAEILGLEWVVGGGE